MVPGCRLKRAIGTIPHLYSKDRYSPVLEKGPQEEIRPSQKEKGTACLVWHANIGFSTQKYLQKVSQLCAFKVSCY